MMCLISGLPWVLNITVKTTLTCFFSTTIETPLMPSQDMPQYFSEAIWPNEIFEPISGFQQSVTYIWSLRCDHIFIQMMDRKPQNLKIQTRTCLSIVIIAAKCCEFLFHKLLCVLDHLSTWTWKTKFRTLRERGWRVVLTLTSRSRTMKYWKNYQSLSH